MRRRFRNEPDYGVCGALYQSIRNAQRGPFESVNGNPCPRWIGFGNSIGVGRGRGVSPAGRFEAQRCGHCRGGGKGNAFRDWHCHFPAWRFCIGWRTSNPSGPIHRIRWKRAVQANREGSSAACFIPACHACRLAFRNGHSGFGAGFQRSKGTQRIPATAGSAVQSGRKDQLGAADENAAGARRKGY